MRVPQSQSTNPSKDPNQHQPSKEKFVFNGNTIATIDSIKPDLDPEVTAKVIAKSCNYNYIPSIRPFREGRFILFYKTRDEAFAAANIRSLKISEATVVLNRVHRMLNVVDSKISGFRGWISSKGLPFDQWNQDNFEIANQFGGLIEIDSATSSFAILSKAKSK